ATGRPVMARGGRRSGAGFCLAQAALAKEPAVVEDRMGDRYDMGVDTLKVAEDVQMQGTRLQAFQSAIAKPLEVPLRRQLLSLSHVDLHLHQAQGEVEVSGHEDGLGDA